MSQLYFLPILCNLRRLQISWPTQTSVLYKDSVCSLGSWSSAAADTAVDGCKTHWVSTVSSRLCSVGSIRVKVRWPRSDRWGVFTSVMLGGEVLRASSGVGTAVKPLWSIMIGVKPLQWPSSVWGLAGSSAEGWETSWWDVSLLDGEGASSWESNEAGVSSENICLACIYSDPLSPIK